MCLQDRYGDLYTAENVAISGIHTHAAPAGFLQYVIYQITSMGFVKQTYDAMVEGIEKVVAIICLKEKSTALVAVSVELVQFTCSVNPLCLYHRWGSFRTMAICSLHKQTPFLAVLKN